MRCEFTDRKGTFRLKDPQNTSYLYFPMAGEQGLMSSITPTLGGDCKTGQNSFLLAPVSSENLHNDRSSRNFFIYGEGFGAWSLVGASAAQRAFDDEQVTLEAGFIWHRLTRTSERLGLASEALSFVPPEGDAVELTRFTVTNISQKPVSFIPYAAYPLYGRSADNFRDHRHVTSLLHRAEVTDYGVLTCPTLTFDERGHKPNSLAYGAFAARGDGHAPASFEPTVERWIGEGGDFERPKSLGSALSCKPGDHVGGFEVVAAMAFERETLLPGESVSFVVALATGTDLGFVKCYLTEAAFARELDRCKAYWEGKLNLNFHTADPRRDAWMRWVSCQPILRRMFGCSFLPHHDYGRGGRGWRDLWQDCLALLLMEPERVRELLVSNFAGVRFDGTNATIIGADPGEFVADRNNITRVWTDHGAWPLNTVVLYIHQTGDLEFLMEKQTYFKDPQAYRGTRTDYDWSPEYGERLKAGGVEYRGTLLEHLLVENLPAYYNVGEHGILRLLGADWNDGLDMAAERGESVPFHCMYARNLSDLADLVERLGRDVKLAEELNILLNGASAKTPADRQAVLERYCAGCLHEISGRTVTVSSGRLASILRAMSREMADVVRRQERIEAEGERWFNSYYDGSGRRVEGVGPGGVRMMLTGQVFAAMSGVAEDTDVDAMISAADRYLYDASVGGYKLNTDFEEVKTDLGRLFGFAYGHKENGAVFCHMAVMYAYALYSRGRTEAAAKAIDTMYRLADNFDISRIYPGLPEYFNSRGRGMYHYLTGSASWLILTELTQKFGVRGEYGDLRISPQLRPEDLDDNGRVSVETLFAGRSLCIVISGIGSDVKSVTADGSEVKFAADGSGVLIPRAALAALDPAIKHRIEVTFA